MEKLDRLHAGITALRADAKPQAAVRLAAELTAPPAAEARMLRIPPLNQHVENNAPRVTVKQQAVARLAAELTATPAVEARMLRTPQENQLAVSSHPRAAAKAQAAVKFHAAAESQAVAGLAEGRAA